MRTSIKHKKITVKRILCPLDFSKTSMKALHIADELSKQFKAELLIFHAVLPVSTITEETDYSFYKFDVPTYEQKLLRAAKERLQTIIIRKVSHNKVRSVVQPGDPARIIIKTAIKKRIDLIVIATHGRSGWTHMIFGSVAEKVIRLAPCPVLVVKMGNKKG